MIEAIVGDNVGCIDEAIWGLSEEMKYVVVHFYNRI